MWFKFIHMEGGSNFTWNFHYISMFVIGCIPQASIDRSIDVGYEESAK